MPRFRASFGLPAVGKSAKLTWLMKFRILLEPDEDGVFVVECPTLPGCVSQGKTRKEAMANIRDAIQGYLHSLEKHRFKK